MISQFPNLFLWGKNNSLWVIPYKQWGEKAKKNRSGDDNCVCSYSLVLGAEHWHCHRCHQNRTLAVLQLSEMREEWWKMAIKRDAEEARRRRLMMKQRSKGTQLHSTSNATMHIRHESSCSVTLAEWLSRAAQHLFRQGRAWLWNPASGPVILSSWGTWKATMACFIHVCYLP